MTHTDPSGFEAKKKSANTFASAAKKFVETVSSAALSVLDNIGGSLIETAKQVDDYFTDQAGNTQVDSVNQNSITATKPGEENIPKAGNFNDGDYGIGLGSEAKENLLVRGAKAYWQGVKYLYNDLNRWSGQILNAAGDILSLPDKAADAITGMDEVERFNMAVNTPVPYDDMIVGSLMAVTRGSRALKAVGGLSKADDVVRVRTYTNAAGKKGITKSGALRTDTWVTLSGEIPSKAGHP